MAQLDREQRRIVRLIRREGAAIRNPRLRRLYERAAVQTGLVETNLHNLSYGDADSQGWRQERASLYKNPTNLRASIRRFRKEFQQQADPGEKSYEIAAQVQRPREDLRGRYRDVAPEAARILRGAPNPAAPGVQDVRGGPRFRTIPGVDNSQTRQQLAQAYFANRYDRNALLGYKAGVDAAQDTPARRIRVAGPANADQPPTTSLPRSAKADRKLERIISEANRIDAAKVPYLWGGGHQAKQIRGTKVTPLDCSGAVSRVLGMDPRVSGQFAGWGAPGRGKRVTVYANGEHVLMEINGHFWGTSATNPGGGAGWIPRKHISPKYLAGFTARHPKGL